MATKLYSDTGWAGIEPAAAYRQAGRLRDLLAAAEDAIAAQQLVIAADGPRASWALSLRALQRDRKQLARELAELLRHRDHETLDFKLDGPRYSHHLADVEHLSAVLGSLGQLFVRVGQRTVGRPIQTVSPALRRQFGLRVHAQFVQGSFGMRLVVDTQSDLLDDEPRRAALQRMLQLSTAQDLTTAAADHGTWTIKKYRELVHRLIEAEATPRLSWKTAFSDEQITWSASEGDLRTLDNRLALLREGQTSVSTAEGTLVEASLVRHTFGMSAQGKVIKGRVPPKLTPQVVTLFGQPVRCTYEERRVLDEATDQERRFVTLLGIEAS
jgi:hypothetical protein